MTKELLIENSGLTFSIDQISNSVREAVDKTGLMILKGVPCSVLEEVNGNGRKYSRKEMQRAIRTCREGKLFESRRLLCSAADHPKESFVPPAYASHIVVDAYSKEENGKIVFKNDWLVLNTESGKNLQALVDAGASFGTSIRGLGQINEDTSEVEQYEFLGTDAVGNPSAGTFASNASFKVTVESLDEKSAKQVREELEGNKMARQNGFDLTKAIEDFKEKHFNEGKPPKTPTREMVGELLSLQLKAVDAGLEVESIDTLSNDIYGEPENNDEAKKPRNTVQHENRDIANRAQRELEATQALATHLKSEVEELQNQKKELEKEIRAYRSVSENLLVQVKEIERESNESTEEATKRIARKALSTITGLQKETHDVITNLETRLETAIRIADTSVEHAITFRRISNSIFERYLKLIDSDPKAFATSKGKLATLENQKSALTEQEQQQRKVASNRSGPRAGWF